MVDFFGRTWRQAASTPESAYSGSEPPVPGDYIIQLAGHQVGEDRGDAYVALDFQLVGVPHSMRHSWRDWRGFGTPERAVAAYRICVKLGVNPNRVQTPDDLDVELRRLHGYCYYARIVQRGEWRNLYVNEQLPAVAADALTRASGR